MRFSLTGVEATRAYPDVDSADFVATWPAGPGQELQHPSVANDARVLRYTRPLKGALSSTVTRRKPDLSICAPAGFDRLVARLSTETRLRYRRVLSSYHLSRLPGMLQLGGSRRGRPSEFVRSTDASSQPWFIGSPSPPQSPPADPASAP